MEPVSEDSIKEVSWRKLSPAPNRLKWFIALLLFLSFILSLVVLGVLGVRDIFKPTPQELELMKKKRELERKLGNASNVEKTAEPSPLPVKKSPETGIYRNE